MPAQINWKSPVSTIPVEKDAPSEEFELAFGGSGSIVIDCEFCNRTHFAPEGGLDWEEGELETLLAKNKINPDQTVACEYDMVSWGYLAGKQYVHGCPCNQAARYERLFWSHRHQIADYLSRRAKSERERLEQNEQTAAKAKQAIQQEPD